MWQCKMELKLTYQKTESDSVDSSLHDGIIILLASGWSE